MGVCGFITQTAFPACRAGLGGDFAIAATNNGHYAAANDTLWAGNSEQYRISFGYRGVHVVAVAAKAIQEACCGQGPERSYFVGCSDGGREAPMEGQRYPDDFDGIIAGLSAIRSAQITDENGTSWRGRIHGRHSWHRDGLVGVGLGRALSARLRPDRTRFNPGDFHQFNLVVFLRVRREAPPVRRGLGRVESLDRSRLPNT